MHINIDCCLQNWEISPVLLTIPMRNYYFRNDNRQTTTSVIDDLWSVSRNIDP